MNKGQPALIKAISMQGDGKATTKGGIPTIQSRLVMKMLFWLSFTSIWGGAWSSLNKTMDFIKDICVILVQGRTG